MEVRCTGCNKLFRVSDDKILGSGVKFGCTRCNAVVKITREDFARYQSTRPAAPALASAQPAVPHAAAAGYASSPDNGDFDLSDPASAAAAMQQEETAPVFVMPEPVPAPRPAPVQQQIQKPQPPPAGEPIPSRRPAAPDPRTEVKVPPKPRTEPPRPMPAAPAKEAARPAPVMTAAPVQTGGSARKFLVIAVVLLVLGGAAAGIKFFLGRPADQATDAINVLQSPEGLQILSASGAVDPANGDLIVTGIVENTTDSPRQAWYVVVDVYDAQNAVLTKGKLVNGKQLYGKHDLEVMARRGVNIEEFKVKSLQEQGVTIPGKQSVPFEIRIMEPPQGMASFNATLQPFDPVQIFKEMIEEQK